jgi:hypothetical protein
MSDGAGSGLHGRSELRESLCGALKCVWHGDVMEEHFWNVSHGTNPIKESIQTSQCFKTAVEFVSLQTSSHILQPWFFLLKAAPLNSSSGVDVWCPSINCRLDSGSNSWTQFSSPIPIYASSRGRLLSFPLSTFVSVGAPKQHWPLNALAFQQLPLLCLERQVGCSIIHMLCNGRCSSNQRMSCITAAQGWLLAICREVLFLLLLVLPSPTVASPYTYGQIFLDTNQLLTCCFNRCTATVYRARNICKYPNPAAENRCFMYQLHQFMAFHFLTKSATRLQTKGMCTTVHILPSDANNCTFPALPHVRPQTYNILWVGEYYNIVLQETMEKNHCIQSESCHLKILLQKL